MNEAPVRCGVIGYPLAHTWSPELHRAFAEQAGIALDYVVLSVEVADFEQAVREFFTQGGRGLNVTLPYKTSALALADEAGALATRAGAANVLTRLDDGRLRADNVDGAGFLCDLAHLEFDVRGAQVCVLGAGGAAAGVICALLEADIAGITVINRHAQRAQALVERLNDDRLHVATPEQNTVPFSLIVNATSASLTGECPNFLDTTVGSDTLAYDLVYAKKPTSFMQRTAEQGAHTSDGWGMLVEQAAESFQLWHGIRPDTSALHVRPTVKHS
ncbi:MAG: shikimate dehydrogenase [Gammaproteobacteria bacterium]